MGNLWGRCHSMFATLLLVLASTVVASGQRVALEIVTEPGFSAENTREWLPALEKCGFDSVRMRSGQLGDGAAIKSSGAGKSISYQITGVLTNDNRLHLPAGRFTLENRAGITKWIEKLKAGGEEGLNAKEGAFGLVPKQLVALHEGLAVKVNFATSGKTSREVVQGIAGLLTMKLKVDPAARGAFGEETVADELQGLSSGTALAAVVRPLGLVLVPVKEGNEVSLKIVDSQAANQVWPVGWPSKSSAKDTLPEMFKFLNVEVENTSLAESMEAIRARLDVPLVVDQNSLARQKIDYQAVKVSLPKTNTYYKSIMDKLLFQVKLKCEVRVDEADQPFLWITTIKQ